MLKMEKCKDVTRIEHFSFSIHFLQSGIRREKYTVDFIWDTHFLLKKKVERRKLRKAIENYKFGFLSIFPFLTGDIINL